MRMVFTVVVEMTPKQAAAYRYEYGLEAGELRENIRSYIQTGLQGSPGLSVEDGSTEGITVRNGK